MKTITAKQPASVPASILALVKELTKKAGISKARFYVSTSNLFIITGYSGYDPEVDVQTGLTCGMDYNRYPRARGFVFGTNITF